MEQAAERARVSRATAYRYFVNQRALLGAVHPEVTAASLLPPVAPVDPLERVTLVAREIMRIVVENEPELRASLRISLAGDPSDAPPPMRRGRRTGWFEDALAPLRTSLGESRTRSYALRLAATVGIEPFIWLRDMGGLSPRRAADALIANARAVAAEFVAVQR